MPITEWREMQGSRCRNDLFRSARVSGVPLSATRKIVDEVLSAVANWPQYAAQAGLSMPDIDRIGALHRVDTLT